MFAHQGIIRHAVVHSCLIVHSLTELVSVKLFDFFANLVSVFKERPDLEIEDETADERLHPNAQLIS